MSEYYLKAPESSTNVRLYTIRRQVICALLRLFRHLAPQLTDHCILRLFFAPVRYRQNAEEKACLMRGQPFQVQVHDKTIQAWKWGRGPGVLLVHGWNGRGAQFHRFIAPLVTAGYTAIAFDGPAHGRSSGRITSYFEFTDVVRALLSQNCALNINGIIAHSFGAAAAINSLDKDRPAITAVCIAPILRLQEFIISTFQRFGIPREIYKGLIGSFEERFGYDLAHDNPSILLGRLSDPLLIVHDTDDRAVPFRDSQKISQKHTNIALYSTRGLGHLRVLSDPAVINASLQYLGGHKLSPERI